MKFRDDPVADRPRALTASLYVGSKETPMLDELHKNDLLHRSMTALQEYKDSLTQQQQTSADNFLASSVSFIGVLCQIKL